MPSKAQAVRLLASAFAAGPIDDVDGLVERVKPLIAGFTKKKWLRPLAGKLVAEFGGAPRPPKHAIAAVIWGDEGFREAVPFGKTIRIAIVDLPPSMAPAAGAPASWDIPEITTLDDLAATLRLHPDDLGWLTSPGQADHYLRRWHRKAKSGRLRLIEIPKPLLKIAQHQVLRRILDRIPPHEAACGFRRGRAVRDFVEPHTGQQLLARMDLEDFFPSITSARVLRLFLTAGYPETVARALTNLSTIGTPENAFESKSLSWAERRRFATRHLPQGAPTSPTLANLCAFRLDCRLGGLAGAAGASYTRYADDLLFSGGDEFARQASRFQIAVSSIVIEEGFSPNARKTRVLRQGQRQAAAGLVLNVRPNIARSEFDRLKAILTNCAWLGPESQNHDEHPEFQAHLRGRIAWVISINPARGERLLTLFEKIEWDD